MSLTLVHGFLTGKASKPLIILAGAASLLYLFVIAFLFPPGHPWLFGLLIFGEIFHTWMALTYLYTVWDLEYEAPKDPSYLPPVDVFITVAGEPLDIIEETAVAARDMDYPFHRVYLLNDGYVAKKANWNEVIELAKRLGVGCLTRTTPGGAKAGNINNGLSKTSAPYVAIFDADHVPHPNFLRETMPYFADPSMGFVQTPQFYKNSTLNQTTAGSWEQQELFYGPICRGKNRLNSVTMCGTNMVLSRRALETVGGMCTESIAEDFATGMFMHAAGYKSVYVPKVLAEGLAPEDFLSYSKQQFRWARGALDVMFRYHVLFRRGLTWTQKIQYLSSASFFLSGVITVINLALPALFLYTGLIPIEVSTMFLAIVFIPYMFVTLYNLALTSNFRFTFQALSFSHSAFNIHIRALIAAVTGQKSSFSITEKRAVTGNFAKLVLPQLTYILVILIGVPIAIWREGLSPSVINNLAWATFNIGIFVPFIKAAVPDLSLKTILAGLWPETPTLNFPSPMVHEPERNLAVPRILDSSLRN